jgi:flagellar hook-associated protein 2
MSGPLFSIGGLASGLDTQAIIAQLVAIEAIQLNQVTAQRKAVEAEQSAWNRVRSAVTGVADAAAALANPGRLNVPVLTSSNPDAVSVTGSMTDGTALHLAVRQLATNAQVAATGFDSANALLGTGRVTTATGAAALGLTGVKAGPGLAAGAHTLTVTTASAAATLTGTAQTGPVVIDAGNNSLTVTGTDGAPVTVTIASGSYANAADLAEAVNTALAAAGTDVRAAADGATVSLRTADHGSAATLTAAGSFAAATGLAGAANGTDAVIDAGGVTTTLTHERAGDQVSVGGLTLTAGTGGLSAGTATVHVFDTTESMTVADLASLVGRSGAGVSAAVVTTSSGPGGTEILFTSRASGTAGAVTVNFDGFAAAPTLTTVRAGADAQVVLGGRLITRSSNTITDLVPGATITLNKVTAPGEDVTITAAVDPADLLERVKKLVSAYNTAYDTAMREAKSDPTGNAVGPLNSNRSLADLVNRLRGAFTSSVGGDGAYTALAQVGVRLGRDGHLSVDEAAFTKAVEQDRDAVTALLAKTGASADTRVAFISAGSKTPAGEYEIVVTQAAQRARVTGAAFGTLAAAETLTISSGSKTVEYTAGAGADAADVATGLTAAMRSAGLTLTATVVDGAVAITSDGYGSSVSFTVSSTGSGTGLDGLTGTGVDAAGTINGQPATGSGQQLTSADGLIVRVGVTAAEVAAAGGSLALAPLTYAPGVAGSVADLIGSFRDAEGLFSSVEDTIARRLEMYDKRTDDLERYLESYQRRITAQFTALELALARMQSSLPDFSSLANLTPAK